LAEKKQTKAPCHSVTAAEWVSLFSFHSFFFFLSQAFSRYIIRAWCSIKLKSKSKMIFILGKTNYKISEKERTKRPTCQEVNNQIGTCIYFSFHLFSQQVFQGIQKRFSGNGAL
jgi:hypothetical protein